MMLRKQQVPGRALTGANDVYLHALVLEYIDDWVKVKITGDQNNPLLTRIIRGNRCRRAACPMAKAISMSQLAFILPSPVCLIAFVMT